MEGKNRNKASTGQNNENKIPLTLDQINSDCVTQVASKYWAPQTIGNHMEFDADIVDQIYQEEIQGAKFMIRRIMMLEFSQYLENYLWPNYKPESSSAYHVLSIVIMVNEKFRERVSAWQIFQKLPENFPSFFKQLMEMSLDEKWKLTFKERTIILIFFNHCFNSLEIDLIRDQVQKLVSLSIWTCLPEGRREQELNSFPKLKKFWKVIQKKDAKENEESRAKTEFERRFLQRLMQKFLSLLATIPLEGDIDIEAVHYCERFLELLIDLEALLPTRRFFNVVMDDCHLVTRCHLSALNHRSEGKLFAQLLDMLKFYARFEINDQTGDPLTDRDMMQLHYDRITALQKAAFVKYSELRRFALTNVASINTREALTKHFDGLSTTVLQDVAAYLKLLPPPDNSDKDEKDKQFLMELLISRHERRASQLEALNEMPLYPTEDIIWNENIVPTEYFSGEGCLALPKLNLQFLTLHDYLLRNFNLFRLESTYEIRQDIEDSVFRMKPWKGEDGSVVFGGWARMAQPITAFSVVEVGKPNIGEKQPSRVRADVSVILDVRNDVKHEWENLRKHDACFLLTVRPPGPPGTHFNFREPFVPQVGLVYVRGCEVEGMLDHLGRIIEEGPDPRPKIPGGQRTFRVWLDCNQYKLDMDRVSQNGEDVYDTFNILMRRKPKENNFKAVLETIRDLMNTDCVVPEWLHDIILGYGDPGAAHYSKMPNQIPALDFNDTFLSYAHLKESFPDHEIRTNEEDGKAGEKEGGQDGPTKLVPPFRLTFNLQGKDILVEPHVIPSRGPYPFNEPKKNAVRFTPTQIEAIRSGMQPGLTMVVGPPGTGKTDVAVQIISNIYHNFPEQRTLIVTHSNMALNQLFEKIMALDIDERHLLRMGHGEEELETEKDFSRYGRVNYVLAKRLELLDQVQRLQQSLGVTGDVAYTCETAGHFFRLHILARWEEYLARVRSDKSSEVAVEDVGRFFPFAKFFDDAPQPIFKGRSYVEDMEIADGCWRFIRKIFSQLEEFRAFELLRSGLDRSRYLLVREAKIIAMTCTHAALKRRELVELGFKYDNILMEEAAQILEIETFIPLLLQTPQDGFNRLKRWIMIGDHHQLPPVIKNMAFQKYSNMEQSLFTRVVRLGVPTVDLDAQGRARPSLCSLYQWRYKKLGNLEHVSSGPEYRVANTGFVYDFQLINVDDFQGVGESEPNPYFFQNLAEAEYVVAVFMYMRLLGYPAEKISILTTYNGQKHLIRDVVNTRCANNPLIGRPSKIDTVDKYQGQQNDYILLSLVRTRAVGHLRDVRRLVVATSRARLGLYVFARAALFANCFELTPTFRSLLQRPTDLRLLPEETYRTERLSTEEPDTDAVMVINDMPQMATFVYDLYRKKVEAIAKDPNAEKPWAKPIEPMQEDVKQPVVEESDSESSEAEVEEVRIINEIEEEEEASGRETRQEPVKKQKKNEEEEEKEEDEKEEEPVASTEEDQDSLRK
ncbi:hypothetical protein GHT06_021858 [Daphnia sinensis]|uniref:RNA helicase aquarius n=1 Tax=Daphnia sinensis TaxID=1820382 RepID=A0AAD5KXK8_9CRUS|nr:hypothetical protein GHT06_021858 [Daphnia sinensis]